MRRAGFAGIGKPLAFWAMQDRKSPEGFSRSIALCCIRRFAPHPRSRSGPPCRRSPTLRVVVHAPRKPWVAVLATRRTHAFDPWTDYYSAFGLALRAAVGVASSVQRGQTPALVGDAPHPSLELGALRYAVPTARKPSVAIHGYPRDACVAPLRAFVAVARRLTAARTMPTRSVPASP